MLAAFLSSILALEKLGGVFNQVEHPLKYTPRRLAVHHQSLIIIETDHAAFTEDAKEKRRKELAKVGRSHSRQHC